ncbi:zincin [Parathielavia hyrcaniae]|uniref:Zincin n=1 Tax=Parathielavia hyrcaniae TaxID=113614 RepID=A0AAN6T389_9PEZI|nr:zincin [Parathielavia hyrcaniae]
MGQWQSQPVCTSAACVQAAAHVLQGLAPNYKQMDPCTDFDQMVCYGTFEHSGDNGGTAWDLHDRTQRILRKIHESSSHAEAIGFKSTMLTTRDSADEYNFDMLRTSYQACMDTDSIVAAGITPLTDLIGSINNYWPLSPDDLNATLTTADLDGFHQATLLVEQLGVKVFHDHCSYEGPVMSDFLNSKMSKICWMTPEVYFGQNLTAYSDPEAMEYYAHTLGEIFRMTYPDLDNGAAAAMAEAVISLEIDMVTLAQPYLQQSGDFFDLTTNVTVSKLAKAAPVLGFDKLLAGLMPSGEAPSTILMLVPDFWPQFSDLLASHSKAALHGFLVWKTTNALAEHVYDETLWTLLGVSPSENRWEDCVAGSDRMIRHIKDRYFISAAYPDLTMQAADKMTTKILAQFKERLNELDWMSEDARKRANVKAERLVQNIGYPKANPDLRLADSVAAYYDGLNFTADHFSNNLHALRFNLAKQYAEANGPPNRHSIGNAAEVNAFYDPTTNSISIPAGYSQLPIFHYLLPEYALYGGLGAVIGHEITHGFDNDGRLWSEDAEREAWWDNATIAAFESRAQCFVDQFSRFDVAVPGGRQPVDGLLTLGENLSDAGGIRAAYHAWAEERRAMPDVWDQKLPGLEHFSQEQLFFVIHGSMWCDAKTPARMARIMSYDNHAPNLVRIKGMTQNSREFREAFKCPNPEPTCELF